MRTSAAASPNSSSICWRRPRRPKSWDSARRISKAASAEQSRLLNQSEFELKHLRAGIGSARKVESDLRTAIIEVEGRSSSATQNLRTENAQLQATLAHARDERDRFARDLGSMKRETEETWASERVENALLRERINDVAAEVARLASALEGPNSPIDAALAAETSRGLSARGADGRHGQRPAHGAV